MKLSAYILAITMLFLLVQPIMLQCQDRMMSAMKMDKSCCAGNKCDKPGKKDRDTRNCDQTNSCNPFAGCSQAHYTTVSRYFCAAYTSPDLPVKIPAQQTALQAGFIVDCWHPPELSQA